MKHFQKTITVLQVIEVRLRFIALLVIMAIVVGYWGTLVNYWEKWTRPAAAETAAAMKDQEYFCPMHPKVTRDRPEANGETPKCPICGMPLSLRKKGEAEPLPQGVTGRVQLSPERVQLAGVQTAEVVYRSLSLETVTVGNVAYDESRLSRIVSRVGGYVEKLYVDRTFVPVKQGDPLAEIYSPELYSTSQELLLASRRGANDEIARNARERLKLLGVSDDDIDAIVASGKALPRLTLRAPRGGQVIGKEIVAGMKVEEGMTLLEIADLSVVWIEADVFEKDIAFLRPEQTIEATVEAVPGKTFGGKIAVIYSRLNPDTRTNRVRFAVENASGELRPGMFATVRIETPATELAMFAGLAKDGQVPAVPEAAVIDTGAKKIAYIEREPGLYEGVEVRLGPRIEGYYPVVDGLKPGQRVAAAGSFLIDAETRLNPAAASSYFGASGGPQAGGPRAATPSSSTTTSSKPSAEISESARKNIEKLPLEDQKSAMEQKYCPITQQPLGSMGMPVAITLSGQKIFLCCSGCIEKAKSDPEGTMKKVRELMEKKE